MVGAQYAQYGMPMDEEHPHQRREKRAERRKGTSDALPTCSWSARSWTTCANAPTISEEEVSFDAFGKLAD